MSKSLKVRGEVYEALKETANLLDLDIERLHEKLLNFGGMYVMSHFTPDAAGGIDEARAITEFDMFLLEESGVMGLLKGKVLTVRHSDTHEVCIASDEEVH